MLFFNWRTKQKFSYSQGKKFNVVKIFNHYSICNCKNFFVINIIISRCHSKYEDTISKSRH